MVGGTFIFVFLYSDLRIVPIRAITQKTELSLESLCPAEIPVPATLSKDEMQASQYWASKGIPRQELG